MKAILQLGIIGLLATSLSGCLLAAAGAGVAAGAYAADHYTVSVKKKKQDADKNSTKSDTNNTKQQ